MAVFDTIPLFIEADFFSDSLHNGGELSIISNRLKVSLIQLRDSINVESYFHVKDSNVSKNELSNIEYSFNGSIWWYFPKSGILTDTALKPNDKLIILFRRKGTHQILQQTIIRRFDWNPLVLGARQRNRTDTFPDYVTSKATYDAKGLLPGFQHVTKDTIPLKPGNLLELQFFRRGLHQDSSILFRLSDEKGGSAGWRRTGHILSLNDLEPGKWYRLETKYAGQDAIKVYWIQAMPSFWQRPTVLGGTILLGTGICFIFYRERKKIINLYTEHTKEKLKSSFSRLGRHTLRNNMTTIAAMIEDDQSEGAIEYLNYLSNIMTSALENTAYEFGKLSEEITLLESFLQMEKIKSHFSFHFHIDPKLDPEFVDFPPMLLMPSVENAVHHGVTSLGKAGMIDIYFISDSTDLVVEIRDNGTNRTQAGRLGHGHGTAITNERLTLFAKLFRKQKPIYSIGHTNEGTRVSFRFQEWLK